MLFSELYNLYFDKIFNYIYRRTLDYETSLDLTQSVFSKIFLKFDSVRSKDEASLKSYCYKVALNCIKDFKRSEKSKKVSSFGDFLGDFSEFDDEFSYKVKLAIQILDRLPEKYSEVLRLKFVEELENDEIAKVLGVKESTVRSLIKRGVEKAREIIGND